MAIKYVGAQFERVVQRFAKTTNAVIETVSGLIPPQFPAKVSDSIFEGLRRHAAMPRAG